MKFYRYKQVARLNFIGFDDELIDNPTSYYNTSFKVANDLINTKVMKFRIDGLYNIKLSNNAKLVLESIFVPCVMDANLQQLHRGPFMVRLKNLGSETNFDSSKGNISSAVLFSHTPSTTTSPVFQYDIVIDDLTGIQTLENEHVGNHNKFTNGVSFFNNSPKTLYNFNIPSNFLHTNSFEFELIYFADADFDPANHIEHFQRFQCSLVIYDMDEEELLFKNTEDVDFKLMKPQNLF